MKAGGVALLAAALLVAGAYADVFGTGANQFSIEFVNIGYAGNAPDDSSGFGAVGYSYRMGQNEITLDQFAKARAADSRIGDGDEGYWNNGTRTVGIGAPASYVSWYEAARFANWLTTGDAFAGVYQFDVGGTLTGVDRSYRNGNNMAYVLPTEDEWYKAAYYKPGNDGSYSLYASGLDTVPIHGTANGWNYNNNGYVNAAPNHMWETGFGAEEQNGTHDMMGNVWEWNESAWDGTLDNMAEHRVRRGGSAGSGQVGLSSSYRVYDDHLNPANEHAHIGFRVAVIPEPTSIAMIGLVSGCALFIRRRVVC